MSFPDDSSTFKLIPQTQNCEKLLELKEHVLIPISPFNSKFNDAYIERLLIWATRAFYRFDILLPSHEASFLIEATGKPPGPAAKTTRHELNRRLSSIYRAMATADISPSKTRILRFSDFQEHKVYNLIRAQAETLFVNHSEFRNLCTEMSSQAISGRLNATSQNHRLLTYKNIEIAVKYIFAEIPFFINTPGLLNVGTSLIAYHRPWPISNSLFSGKHPLSVSKFQGFIQLLDEPFSLHRESNGKR
jgi:cyclo(L-leucyl-L-leucyl) synthase